MRILFLAPTYMELYKSILDEMERQGHKVTFVEDVMYKWDWKYPWRGCHDRFVRRMRCFTHRLFQKYWDKFFSSHKDLDDMFDLLFVINGCSLHESFFKRIENSSPNIRKILYLWDNSKFFDYYYYSYKFDKVLTYDIDDSIKYKAELLPFYWEPVTEKLKKLPIRYKMSMVGSNHDGRLNIVKSIVPQLQALGFEYCFRIVDNNQSYDSIIANHPIPVEETQRIMMQSECILDTDRESQSGTTPRLIWALAMCKKVVTTNQNIKRMPFYDPALIYIIDRHKPVIDSYFINSEPDFSVCHKMIENYKIDNWIKNFLYP